MGYYLLLVRFMTHWEWQPLSSFLPNYSCRICAGMTRFLAVTCPIGECGSVVCQSFLSSLSTCVKPADFERIVTSQIHHFCDASQAAYGAVSYLGLVNQDGRIHCSFLVGKSRLAPLRQMTIPRLELAAATVSIRLNC